MKTVSRNVVTIKHALFGECVSRMIDAKSVEKLDEIRNSLHDIAMVLYNSGYINSTMQADLESSVIDCYMEFRDHLFKNNR